MEDQEEDENWREAGKGHEQFMFQKQQAPPPLHTLKDYHDIINDLVDKRMKQISIEQSPQVSKSELEKPEYGGKLSTALTVSKAMLSAWRAVYLSGRR